MSTQPAKKTNEVAPSLPNHVAIILDGNGRWAEQQSLDRMEGHKAGAETARTILQAAIKANIQYLTLFCFSSENWHRAEKEVSALMALMEYYLSQYIDDLLDHNVQLQVIGEKSRLTETARAKIAEAEAKTAAFTNPSLKLILALDYGGRWDMCQAVQKIATAAKQGTLDPSDIDEEMIDNNLTTAHIPPPDLLIRSGGEMRLSNFLLWQLAYTELIFIDKLWPAFTAEDFDNCLQQYSTRIRRFGS